MGVYFGVTLQKTEYNTAKLGERDIFALDGQFSECSEFCGWRSDLSIDYMPKKFRPFFKPTSNATCGWHIDEHDLIGVAVDSQLIVGIPLAKLTHSQKDYTYLVLERCLRDGLAPSMITKPKDQQSEMIRSYRYVPLRKNVFGDVLVFEAQKDDMFCYIEPNNLTLYLVSENGVESFTSETYDGLRERVFSDGTMSLSEKVKNSLNSFGPRYWYPVYPEKEW